MGFIGYWGLIFRAIFGSYKVLKLTNADYILRLLSYSFMIIICLFAFNEIKVDSISFPQYFAITIIWMGLAFASINNIKMQTIIQLLKERNL
jgi:hypothetical protein